MKVVARGLRQVTRKVDLPQPLGDEVDDALLDLQTSRHA
jgi:hypothetical protein